MGLLQSHKRDTGDFIVKSSDASITEKRDLRVCTYTIHV